MMATSARSLRVVTASAQRAPEQAPRAAHKAPAPVALAAAAAVVFSASFAPEAMAAASGGGVYTKGVAPAFGAAPVSVPTERKVKNLASAHSTINHHCCDESRLVSSEIYLSQRRWYSAAGYRPPVLLLLGSLLLCAVLRLSVRPQCTDASFYPLPPHCLPSPAPTFALFAGLRCLSPWTICRPRRTRLLLCSQSRSSSFCWPCPWWAP